ncbi:hypothetical protein ACFB49_30720 [Sphingomonas sp. DBB INV C78]|uniref:phytanoyl-CoA dioxygenase family protein n=1 Tax=Sphingomonas sp. DBB INV C78 TaxID=3349434 RepID=UPI0036D267DB
MNDMTAVLAKRDVNVGSAKSLGLSPVDFKAMHEIILPHRLRRGVSDEIAWDVANAAPIALQTPQGLAYTYVCQSNGVRIVPGVSADAELVIELSSDAWQNYYYELRTRYGLLYEEAVRFVRGKFRQWDAWEPALRCLYSGTPIYNPKALDLRDRDGSPLDLRKSFDRDADPEAMAHYLRTTGYLHVRSAYTPDEIERLSEETDRLRDSSVEGDVFSRWASNSDGIKKVWDLHYMALNSELMNSLDTHPVTKFLTGLSHEHVIPAHDRDNGTHAILREFTSGAANSGSNYSLGWHQDCGLGGCPITCPRVHVGIQLDAATPESSQLFFLAGSAGRTCHDQFSKEEWDQLPVVTFETQPGDATVHLGCGLHAAPASNGHLRRRTLYLRHQNRLTQELLGKFQTFDQVIPHVHEMPTVAEMAAKVEEA